ncbi:MAG: hypothetical protein GXP01_11185 [Alphaproteobacteria bacterium]|nr:hypothetical protein [Alphaproteobacteria bacterium]
MGRHLLWALGGLVLGAILHLVVILLVPVVSEQRMWATVARAQPFNTMTKLERPKIGAPNPFALDPGMVYASCRLNIARAPGALAGNLPGGFWSVALYEPGGRVIYSTTSRISDNKELVLGIFNSSQTRLLAEQRIDIEEGQLVVEAPGDDVLAVIRVFPEFADLAERRAEQILDLECGNSFAGTDHFEASRNAVN